MQHEIQLYYYLTVNHIHFEILQIVIIKIVNNNNNNNLTFLTRFSY